MQDTAIKYSREPQQIDVVSLDPGGFGLSADRQSAVLGSLPGEVVIAEPWTKKRRKLFFKVNEVIKASADRVVPECPAADNCGGCSLQHFAPAAQIQFKQAQLVDCLGENQPDNLLPPLTGPAYGYRSKARLGVKFVEKKDRLLVGFREKMKPFVADISACKILRPVVGEHLEEIAELIAGLSNPRCIPQIEVAVGDEDTALVVRHLEDLTDQDHASLRQFGADNCLDIYLQPGNVESVHKIFPEDGNERLVYRLADYELEYGFHPMDFTQVNAEINRRMIPLALAQLQLATADVVLDAFCGIGNFSLPLARTAERVLGVELSTTSVARGAENAQRNGLDNVSFIAADLFAEDVSLNTLIATEATVQPFNKVLLDPPRSGALELCKKLAGELACNKPERVVYVSCNPVTLARDAQILVAGGYRFEAAGVMDMFPHTNHVETLACFVRCDD